MICNNCGNSNENGVQFCSNCGYKLNANGQNAQQNNNVNSTDIYANDPNIVNNNVVNDSNQQAPRGSYFNAPPVNPGGLENNMQNQTTPYNATNNAFGQNLNNGMNNVQPQVPLANDNNSNSNYNANANANNVNYNGSANYGNTNFQNTNSGNSFSGYSNNSGSKNNSNGFNKNIIFAVLGVLVVGVGLYFLSGNLFGTTVTCILNSDEYEYKLIGKFSNSQLKSISIDMSADFTEYASYFDDPSYISDFLDEEAVDLVEYFELEGCGTSYEVDEYKIMVEADCDITEYDSSFSIESETTEEEFVEAIEEEGFTCEY